MVQKTDDNKISLKTLDGDVSEGTSFSIDYIECYFSISTHIDLSYGRVSSKLIFEKVLYNVKHRWEVTTINNLSSGIYDHSSDLILKDAYLPSNALPFLQKEVNVIVDKLGNTKKMTWTIKEGNLHLHIDGIEAGEYPVFRMERDADFSYIKSTYSNLEYYYVFNPITKDFASDTTPDVVTDTSCITMAYYPSVNAVVFCL